MPKSYDATLKHVFDTDPERLVALLRLAVPLPAGPVAALDADLSTVSPAGDRLLRIGDDFLLQVEVQASRDAELPRRALVYNVLAGWRHRLPAETVILLLRPEADAPELSGELQLAPPGGTTRLSFRYSVVRLWTLPLAPLLAHARWAPLAPLTDEAAGDLAGAVRQATARIERDAPSAANELLAATRILLGLRYNADVAEAAFQGVRNMRESSIYQKIVREGLSEGRSQGLLEGRSQGLSQGLSQGRADEARRLLLRVGERRFGPAPAPVRERLAALADADALEEIFDRLDAAADWSQALDGR